METNDEDADFRRLSGIMSRAIGENSKRAAVPPFAYEHAKHQDVWVWLNTCKDLFDRRPHQKRIQAECIKYALGEMKGEKVAPFALSYRKQMTGELGFTRQEGYELWDIFAEQTIRRFGPTHEGEKALREMSKVRYKGDINKYLLEMENLNIHVNMTGISWRKLIEDQLPVDTLRRLSLREFTDDREWEEAVRLVARQEEDFKERQGLRGDNSTSAGSTSSGKRKRDDPKEKPAKKVRPQYTAAEKAAYQKKQAGKRKVKQEVKAATGQKIVHKVWKTAHEGIDDAVVDQRKKDSQCTRCGMDNHGWKHCRKEIRVSTIKKVGKPYRKPTSRPDRPPYRPKPRVAAVADDSRGESSQRASQRPLAWTFDDDEEL